MTKPCIVVVTGGAPGYFVRHYSVAELVKTGGGRPDG